MSEDFESPSRGLSFVSKNTKSNESPGFARSVLRVFLDSVREISTCKSVVSSSKVPFFFFFSVKHFPTTNVKHRKIAVWKVLNCFSSAKNEWSAALRSQPFASFTRLFSHHWRVSTSSENTHTRARGWNRWFCILRIRSINSIRCRNISTRRAYVTILILRVTYTRAGITI